MAGRCFHPGGLSIGHQVGQRHRAARREYPQRATHEKRQKQAGDGEIERERRVQRDDRSIGVRLSVFGEALGCECHVLGQPAVGDGHTLGKPGGSRRVDQVRGVFEIRVFEIRVDRTQCRSVDIVDIVERWNRVEDQCQTGIVADMSLTLFGIVRVDRGEGRAGAQDRMDSGDRIDRAGHTNADHVAPANSLGLKYRSDRVDPVGKLHTGERTRRVGNDRVGPLPEESMHRSGNGLGDHRAGSALVVALRLLLLLDGDQHERSEIRVEVAERSIDNGRKVPSCKCALVLVGYRVVHVERELEFAMTIPVIGLHSQRMVGVDRSRRNPAGGGIDITKHPKLCGGNVEHHVEELIGARFGLRLAKHAKERLGHPAVDRTERVARFDLDIHREELDEGTDHTHRRPVTVVDGNADGAPRVARESVAIRCGSHCEKRGERQVGAEHLQVGIEQNSKIGALLGRQCDLYSRGLSVGGPGGVVELGSTVGARFFGPAAPMLGSLGPARLLLAGGQRFVVVQKRRRLNVEAVIGAGHCLEHERR